VRVYRGRRDRNGEAIVEVLRDKAEPGAERDPVTTLSPRHDLHRHSPTGYDWGYPGSGPAQLALGLLSDVLRGQALDRALAPFAAVEPRSEAELAAGPRMDAAAAAGCEEADRRALELHQHFKFDVVADLCRDSWALSEDQVLAWIAAFAARAGEGDCAGCGGVHE